MFALGRTLPLVLELEGLGLEHLEFTLGVCCVEQGIPNGFIDILGFFSFFFF